ncbi:MAG: MerR family transcriptional regulator [Marmoricola sp.]
MSVAVRPEVADGPAWTIDELAMRVGMTVRTTRYYASLGLLPAPERRGRIAYYDDRHRIRLEIIRTMQERGFSLAGIEQQLSQLRDDTSLADLEVRRSMLNSWAPSPTEVLDREGLHVRAGRVLTDPELDELRALGAVRAEGPGTYVVMPTFDVSVALLDLDVSPATIRAAADIIADSMSTMVRQLGGLMRTDVVEPFRKQHEGSDPDAVEHFESTLRSLRQLSLDAVIAQFQVALNNLATPARGARDDSNH